MSFLQNGLIMKAIIIITSAITLLLTDCQRIELKEDSSNCIEQKIREFENNTSLCESGKSVYRYKFQDEFVYVFNPGDCGADMMSEVYDDTCNRICGLGGIAGNMICNGENFWQKATDEKLIWEN